MWYNKQHFRPLRATTKKDFEIFQKTFQKPLDKVEEMWYNTEAVRESDSESIIEN